MIHDQSADPRLVAHNRIDKICDAFEAAWLGGDRPQIVSFLDLTSLEERPTLFYELLLMEIEYRQQAGESPTRDDYLKLFPDFAEQIESLHFKQEFAAVVDESPRPAISTSTLVRGARIAQFELHERLGTGAVGEVWKAQDTRLQRTVAIKVPREQNLSEAELHRFLREGRAAAQLQHANIVRVFDANREGEIAYIVSDFVAGESLRDRLKHGHLSFVQTAEFCAKLADALHHAHEVGIVHRDLKPANVLVDLNDQPHIADFGLAKWINDARDLTLDGQLLGTPAYMSPEQARGETSCVNHSTDIYSLGAVLYEMICGQRPFQGDEVSVIQAIADRDPPAPRQLDRSIPRDLETICLKAMDKLPGRRYATAQEMAVDLRRYLRDEPILARRANYIERVFRWLRRRPAAGAAIVLAVGVAIAALTIISLQEQNHELQGYRPFDVSTNPPGASLAIVAIDPRTGELDPLPAKIIRPLGKTPLRTWLKPGEYFIEAVLRRADGQLDFAEANQTVLPRGVLAKQKIQDNRRNGEDPDLQDTLIQIQRTNEITSDMIAVPIDEALRRKDPLLPSIIYVDAKKTTPVEIQTSRKERGQLSFGYDERAPTLTLDDARQWANEHSKRLPSASEFDAIVQSAIEHQLRDGEGHLTAITELNAGLAEWTTTKYDINASGDPVGIAKLRAMHVLKGYGNPDQLVGLTRTVDNQLIAAPDTRSTYIGVRGVRSGAPRFMKP